MAKQQKNFRLSDECCEQLKTQTLRLIAEGHKVTETDVVELAINQFRIATAPTAIQKTYSKSVSKKEVAIQERASSDLTAQVVERKDIDYSDVDSTPTTHIVNMVAANLPRSTGKLSGIANWRAGRKPLLRPKERK